MVRQIVKKARFGDARDGDTIQKNRSTMPPRTREGKSFPGGRHSRRAMKRLTARQNQFAASSNEVKNASTKPGSLR